MTLEGGCACGATRYTLTNTPMIVHACHCRDCRRLSGSAFALNLWIERKFVEEAGAAPGDTLLVRAGTLDDPTGIQPDVHIFTRSKLPWLELPKDARAFPAFYKFAEVWPPASLARWRDVIG